MKCLRVHNSNPIGATTASTTTKTIPSRAKPDIRRVEGIRLGEELV